MRCLVSDRLMWAAALMFLVQVKQCAKIAYAKGRPSRGKSSRDPSRSPAALVMDGIRVGIGGVVGSSAHWLKSNKMCDYERKVVKVDERQACDYPKIKGPGSLADVL